MTSSSGSNTIQKKTESILKTINKCVEMFYNEMEERISSDVLMIGKVFTKTINLAEMFHDEDGIRFTDDEVRKITHFRLYEKFKKAGYEVQIAYRGEKGKEIYELMIQCRHSMFDESFMEIVNKTLSHVYVKTDNLPRKK